VEHPSSSDHGIASAVSQASALLHVVASEGRDTLARPELATLLSTLGVGFEAMSASPVRASDVDLRISLDATREFGMVISAGVGGLDAALAEAISGGSRRRLRRHRKHRRRFLRLFRRDRHQKLVAIAQRDGQAPRPVARGVFRSLLALARSLP
jgi:hypothetical protein